MSAPPFFSLFLFLGVSESVALSVGFDDVYAVREPIEQCAGEPLVAKHFSPCFEGQVCGHDHAGSFVYAANHFKEEFGSGFADG